VRRGAEVHAEKKDCERSRCTGLPPIATDFLKILIRMVRKNQTEGLTGGSMEPRVVQGKHLRTSHASGEYSLQLKLTEINCQWLVKKKGGRDNQVKGS